MSPSGVRSSKVHDDRTDDKAAEESEPFLTL